MDAKLDVKCSFQIAEDGQLRCLPSQDNFEGGEYLDPQCTEQVGAPICSPTPPSYVSVQTSGTTCNPVYYGGPTLAAYALGPPMAAGTVYIHVASVGACGAVTNTNGPVYPMTHVDASAFVAATESVVERGDGLASIVIAIAFAHADSPPDAPSNQVLSVDARTAQRDTLEMLDRVTGGNVDLLASRVPMGRAASADEVARAIAWVASPEASFVTGAVLPVNGGMCAA